MAFSQAARDAAAVARQRNKEARTAEKISSTGFGPSKVFAAPPGEFPDPDVQLRDLHIEGKRIGDHFSDEQITMLRREFTDEGIAERNAGKSDLHVRVGNPLDKQRERKRDDVLERGMEPWQASDPMREVLNANPHAGFRRRFLSDDTVKKKGKRGWNPVIGENGDPVKLGGMVLAEMPEELAQSRNRHYAGLGNQRLKQVQEKYMEGAQGSAVSDQ